MTTKGDRLTEKEIRETITTQEQESIVEEEKQDKNLRIKIVGWNTLLYLLSVFIIFLAIQHSCFFYGYPPSMARWVVGIPVYLYFLLGMLVFILLKFQHYVTEQGMIFYAEAPAEKLADEESD